ncbi:unnamed protein product [Rotaria sordida]|uniref:Uncharacterized protein n=1 Tax=Rotaria sordida TaxID=392033 RepID=A0A815EID1_9BILA|nr:unnamed protein product [Rotaria sordida]CAF1311847.1 unnamed protein product [Rotaria sordida]CAF3634164.1 unnamed protein product [Rotaria sordida]CAF3713741.1 unnamed protein product [Rotaria sordida]
MLSLSFSIQQLIHIKLTLNDCISAAYLLAVLGDNSSPDVAAAAKLLSIVRIECDEECARKLVDSCQGKDNK